MSLNNTMAMYTFVTDFIAYYWGNGDNSAQDFKDDNFDGFTDLHYCTGCKLAYGNQFPEPCSVCKNVLINFSEVYDHIVSDPN